MIGKKQEIRRKIYQGKKQYDKEKKCIDKKEKIVKIVENMRNRREIGKVRKKQKKKHYSREIIGAY